MITSRVWLWSCTSILWRIRQQNLPPKGAVKILILLDLRSFLNATSRLDTNNRNNCVPAHQLWGIVGIPMIFLCPSQPPRGRRRTHSICQRFFFNSTLYAEYTVHVLCSHDMCLCPNSVKELEDYVH